MNLWEDCPDVRPLTFHPRLGQAAAELLGVDAVRLWHDQALYKEPGGRATDAHQDHAYWPIKETASVTAWVPFDGSRRGAGAMAYLPGSHLIGLRGSSNIFRRRTRGHPRPSAGAGHRARLRGGPQGLGRLPPRPDRAPRRGERRTTAPGRCTRSSTSPTGPPAATGPGTSPSTGPASQVGQQDRQRHDAHRLAPRTGRRCRRSRARRSWCRAVSPTPAPSRRPP